MNIQSNRGALSKKEMALWPPEKPAENQTEPSDWVGQWAPFWGIWVWSDECTGSSAVELYGDGYITEKASLILGFLIMHLNFWKEYSGRRISLINHCLPRPTTTWMTMNDLMLSRIIILTPLSSRPVKCIRFIFFVCVRAKESDWTLSDSLPYPGNSEPSL